MKRLLSLFLVLLAVSSTASIAEGIDFSDMDIEELIEIRDAIEDEIVERGGEESYITIAEGDFTVGKDIGAGEYELRDEADDNQSISPYKGEYGWKIRVFPSESLRDECDILYSEYERALEVYYDLDEEERGEYSGPISPDEGEYYEQYYIPGCGWGKISLEDGEVLRIEKRSSNGMLLIRPWTEGLFMD